MKKIFFLLSHSMALFVLACSNNQANYTNCGIVIAKNYCYDTEKGQYVSSQINCSPDTKIWYKDSMAIVKTMGYIIEQDGNGPETRRLELLHYTFVDLKNKYFYQYHSFSDTAVLIKQFTPYNSDSAAIVMMMWTFFNKYKIPTSEPVQTMTDTIIAGIVYKRNKLINTIYSKEGDWKNVAIAYYRCDKQQTLFKYDEQFSNQMGCPMVKIQYLPSPPLNIGAASLSEIEFVSEELTPEELKVFDAWEKNELRYPMKK